MAPWELLTAANWSAIGQDPYAASIVNTVEIAGVGALTPEVIAALYGVDAADVTYTELPTIRAVKISFPRGDSREFRRPRFARRPAAHSSRRRRPARPPARVRRFPMTFALDLQVNAALAPMAAALVHG